MEVKHLWSFCVDSSESVARVAWVGLSGVDVAIEALVGSWVADHREILLFQQIHFAQGLDVLGEGARSF